MGRESGGGRRRGGEDLVGVVGGAESALEGQVITLGDQIVLTVLNLRIALG